MRVAYHGAGFYGWQRQDGFESVQEALEEAFEGLLGTRVIVHGAGRTDTGVHALGQVASCHLDTPLDDHRLQRALNAHLDERVAVTRLETCRPDFHARFDARGKRYAYLIATASFRPPFSVDLCHWVRDPLDLEAMRAAARHFVGEQDFAALASAGSPRASTVRTLRRVRLVPRARSLAIVVEGDGFLYNMVRTIAGTLLDVGRGRFEPGDVRAMLDSRDRRRAGPTAPAAGLWLLRVKYDEPLFPGRVRGPRGAPGVFQY